MQRLLRRRGEFDKFWNQAGGKPVNLQGSQCHAHEQEHVQEPHLSRSQLRERRMWQYPIDNIFPQGDTVDGPTNNAVGDKGKDKDDLIYENKGRPCIVLSWRRKESIQVYPNERHGWYFRAASKENCVVMHHLEFQTEICREASQNVMNQEHGIL